MQPVITAPDDIAISQDSAIPGVVGSELRVPLITGETVEYAHFDHAASAPCLTAVQEAVTELLPWYASVHRGGGFASQVCTRIFERARAMVGGFIGARPGDSVVFTRNTTDALNLLARAVPRGTHVVVFDTEHHAAVLPWRGGQLHRVATPRRTADLAPVLDDVLAGCPEGPRLVVLSGASNVTGELWPVRELTRVARQRGARTVLDAAQLAPHRQVRMDQVDVDYVVLSGHKLYAPFGAGALVGRADWLNAAPPYLAGGGATQRVHSDGAVSWARGPQRHEAGTPNLVGAHALATACEVLGENWSAVEHHERALFDRLRTGARTVPGLRELSLFGDEADRLGVLSCVVDGWDAGLLSAVLSAEHGVGARDGLFCAHVGVDRMLADLDQPDTRALRFSLGLGTTVEHVDRLIGALIRLGEHGPRGRYEYRDGRWSPVDDFREWPDWAG